MSTVTPHDMDVLMARLRPGLGSTVDAVVLDLHRLPEGDPVLARAAERLRVRLLVHGVRVEVLGAPVRLRARLGDGRPTRYRVQEHRS